MSGSEVHIFHGSFNPDTVVGADVPGTVIARYVRVYPKSWKRFMSMRLGISVCHTGYKIALSSSTLLTTVQELRACYATRRSEGALPSEYMALANNLSIVADPQPSTVYAKQAEITGLTLSGSGGELRAGDLIALQPGTSCSSVLASPEQFPSGPTPLITLEQDGLMGLEMVLDAQLNELAYGSYTICHATSESRADHESDFHSLGGRFVVERVRVQPSMVVPRTVPLGTEIWVHWTAGSGRSTKAGEWVGLYKSGACPQLDLHDDDLFPADIDTTAPLEQNKCHLAWYVLPFNKSAGTVRFSAAEYGLAVGSYEVRYFQGDSRDGQGQVCRRLQGSPSETFLYCALEHLKVSSAVEVLPSLSEGTYEYSTEADKMPGLEAMIDKDSWEIA